MQEIFFEQCIQSMINDMGKGKDETLLKFVAFHPIIFVMKAVSFLLRGPPPTPSASIVFFILMQFPAKNMPDNRLAPLPREILDTPLESVIFLGKKNDFV